MENSKTTKPSRDWPTKAVSWLIKPYTTPLRTRPRTLRWTHTHTTCGATAHRHIPVGAKTRRLIRGKDGRRRRKRVLYTCIDVGDGVYTWYFFNVQSLWLCRRTNFEGKKSMRPFHRRNHRAPTSASRRTHEKKINTTYATVEFRICTCKQRFKNTKTSIRHTVEF